ncbi:hypothetical protein [Sporosarcina koreensis]|uniref:hypothetical protein n=1 Tax=Sporosarcina koreensis TaxID=334735 RepID=UPI00058BBFA0|nr:hypothetical protein [Sporosarcina koreensis]
MHSKAIGKRRILQWIALGIVQLTLIVKLVLFSTGAAQKFAYSTLDAMTWIGFSAGILVLLASYLASGKAEQSDSRRQLEE